MINIRTIRNMLLLVFGLLLSASWAQAEVRVPAIFSNGMVLQRDHPLPIWGRADAREHVTVQIGQQSKSADADAKGDWRVTFDPIHADGPVKMTIKGQNSSIVVSDILVGEVWLCSGQSNMDFALRRSEGAQEAIAESNLPEIRLFKVKRNAADEPQSDCGGAWTRSSPESAASFSAVGFYFGNHLHDELKVPIGLIQSSWGGTPAESWTSRAALESDPDFAPIFERAAERSKEISDAQHRYDAAIERWKSAVADARAKGAQPPRKPAMPLPLQVGKYPTKLYNGMIAPIAPFAIRGVIWYQGEANATRAYQYRKLLPAMIRNWRSAWADESLPFGIVQLPNFGKQDDSPVQPSAWAELREAQSFIAQHTPHVGVITTIDLGDPGNIHPTRKRPVGDRLALWAMANVYGRSIEWSGPIYRSMTIQGNRIRLSFDHVGKGLKAAGSSELHGFAIAGDDRNFVAAEARIDGNDVIIWSEKVPNPVAVRYAWGNSPDCNLYNDQGLPASPFRTDTWPGVTDDQR